MFACPISFCAILTSIPALHRSVQYVCLKQYGTKSFARGRGGISAFRYVLHPIDMFISLLKCSYNLIYDDLECFLPSRLGDIGSNGFMPEMSPYSSSGMGTYRSEFFVFVPRICKSFSSWSISLPIRLIASSGRHPHLSMMKNRRYVGSFS